MRGEERRGGKERRGEAGRRGERRREGTWATNSRHPQYGTRASAAWSPTDLLQPINVAAVAMAMGSSAHLHKDGWQGEGVPCFFGLVLACAAAALGEGSASTAWTACAITAMSILVAVWQRFELTTYVLDAESYTLNTEMTPSFHASILIPTVAVCAALVSAATWLSGGESRE